VPDQRQQFRVLYRDFLFRIVDIELLSASGDVRNLLTQLAALLAASNFLVAIMVVPRLASSNLSGARLTAAVAVQVDFMIATSMAAAGLVTLLMWNAILPDRRDCFVLGVLPVRTRTICKAKVAALTTALGVTIAATNFFTSICLPFMGNSPGSGVLRSVGAYWLTMIVAGLFVCSALLSVQGVVSQILSHHRFQRFSSWLQFLASS
jgi:hypothetical protein